MRKTPQAKQATNHQPTAAATPRYSAHDLQLKRYLELDQSIKLMTKEFELIKDALKHEGSHSTHNYVVAVTDATRTNPPSLAALVATFGERVKELCTTSTYKLVKVYKTVKVSPKAGV